MNQSKENSVYSFDNIVEYINSNYKNMDMTLKTVANTFSYSEKYLSSLFKKKMNINFNSYLNNLRIQCAVSMIKNGFSSVTAISAECGFSDPMYFSKVFKRKTGSSPSEMIKQNIR